MTEEKTKLEVIAPSVEEAIEKGLRDLGLTEDDVEVEVLDEGKKGLLGLTTRQARVALRIRTEKAPSQPQSRVEELPQDDKGFKAELTTDEDEAISIARETINIILEKMRVEADVTVRIGESDPDRVSPILIDIEGRDLSFLIGRKAETIDALQYITGLIVCRELGRWVPLLIDVQHYRQRREDELRKLAKRIAEQVIKTGRAQTLEPMHPNERRIIHITLREYSGVETDSTGEEPRRKVTIRPVG